jgi:hypothetical protein
MKDDFDKVFTIPRRGDPKTLRRIAEEGTAENAPVDVEALLELADGNFGGITVVTRLSKAARTDVIEQLRKKGMRGEQIWVGYKYGCNENLNAFARAVLAWDPIMLAAVNKRCDEKLK